MTKYLTKQEVYLLHKAIMKKHGDEEQAGIRDKAVFESALERPKAHYFGEEQYPDIFDKAAVFLDSLTNNHPFHNGNKRTAYAATKAFLKLNGYHLRMPTEEGIDFMVGVAQKKYEVPKEIASILRQYCI